MPGKVNIYGLGEKGVNVDKSDIHVEDSELRRAQNFQIDNIGEKGGIRRRDGMDKFNTAGALAGGVRGLIGLPLPDPNTLTRRFFAPVDDHGLADSGIWRSSSNGTAWATSAALSTPPEAFSINAALMGTLQLAAPVIAAPWMPLDNVIYYPSADFVEGTDDPPIHAYDGTTDFKLVQIPNGPFATSSRIGRIISIQPYDERTLMVSTWDDNTCGRVVLLDVRTGQMTTLGAQSDMSSFNLFPPCPVVYQGRVFFLGCNVPGSATGKVFWTRPGDTTWTRETAGDTDTGVGHCVGGCVFKGNLYFGTIAEVGGSSKIRKRTSAAVWSSARTNSSATLGNTLGPMVVSLDGTKMFVWENVTGGSSATSTVNLQRVLETSDGASYSQVFDVGATVNNSFVNAGPALVDSNGDIYWIIVNASPNYPSLIIKRTNAGVWSVVDNNSARLRGQIMRIKF